MQCWLTILVSNRIYNIQGMDSDAASSSSAISGRMHIRYGCREVEGIPTLVGDIRVSNFRTWWRHCSRRLESLGLLKYVRGNQTRRPRRCQGESEEALKLRRQKHFEEAERARQIILFTLPPTKRVVWDEVESASELWLYLRDRYGGLEEPDHALEMWNNFARFQYEHGNSRSEIEEFCLRYLGALELCHEAKLAIDPKIQTFQFMEKLEEHFPEWYREKKDIILKYTRTISEASQIPEPEDLMKVVVILETQSISVLTDDVSRRPNQ